MNFRRITGRWRQIINKKKIKRIRLLFMAMLASVAACFIKVTVFDAEWIAANPYNRRINADDGLIRKGDILDRNGEIITYSLAQNDSYIRQYTYGRAFAHVIGFTGRGKAGIELVYNFKMQQLYNELSQRFNALSGKPLQGNSIVTTFDANLQQFIYEKLGGRNGAVVVMEPSTGKIIAMVSAPGFDPNTIADDWNGLSAASDSPFVNRVAQGLYPPGSVFKVITAASAIENGFAEYTLDCGGSADIDGSVINCYNSNAHGTVDLKKAMEVSCNAYFASLGKLLGAEAIIRTAERFYFNSDFGFALESNVNKFLLTGDSSVSELIATSIGQGKTLSSPLGTALVYSAIANGGLMMKPYLVDRTVKGSEQNGNIKTIEKFYPKALGRAVSPETAEQLTQILTGVVENGTGSACRIEGIAVAGKTGTAQNESGNDHSWFAAFAPAEKPETVIVVLLEQTGGGSSAVELAAEIFKFLFEIISE